MSGTDKIPTGASFFLSFLPLFFLQSALRPKWPNWKAVNLPGTFSWHLNAETIQTIKKYQGRRKGNKAESPGAWAVLRERPLSSQADLVSSSVVKRDDLGPALQLGYANQTCLTKLPRQIMAISTLPTSRGSTAQKWQSSAQTDQGAPYNKDQVIKILTSDWSRPKSKQRNKRPSLNVGLMRQWFYPTAATEEWGDSCQDVIWLISWI